MICKGSRCLVMTLDIFPCRHHDFPHALRTRTGVVTPGQIEVEPFFPQHARHGDQEGGRDQDINDSRCILRFKS